MYAQAAEAKPATTANGLTTALEAKGCSRCSERPELHPPESAIPVVVKDDDQLNFALTPDLNQTVTVRSQMATLLY